MSRRTHCSRGHHLSGENVIIRSDGGIRCKACTRANNRASNRRREAGLSDTQKERRKLFWVWCDMRHRCSMPSHRQFADYGGRGIEVCERWQKFENFITDMGPRPSSGHSIDRRDNDLGYEPDNCRWATRTEQNSNRRYCIYVKHSDETVTLKEYCRREDLKYRPIVKRIRMRGWPIDLALSVPVGTGVYLRDLEAAHHD